MYKPGYIHFRKILSIYLTVSGSLLLLASISSFLKNYQFVDRGLKIQGDVFSISQSKCPEVEVFPVGKLNLIKASADSSSDYEVGDRVTVLCLENAKNRLPSNCKIGTFGALWSETVNMTLIGIGHLIFGLSIANILRSEDG
jgi:hypothetical protein